MRPSKIRDKNKNVSAFQMSSKRKFASAAQPGAAPQPGSPEDVAKREERVAAARLTAQQQQIMAKEDEINPTSLGGMMVIAIGAAIFYWLYNVDNTKHAGISSFLSRFTTPVSLEDLISKQESKPIHKIPDNWNAFRVTLDHFKNFFYGMFETKHVLYFAVFFAFYL